MTLDSVWRPYTQMQTAPEPITATRTEGSRIWLADGRCLIDGIASWWTACHGYNHPHIVAAVHAQLERMPHVMLGGIVHEPVVNLSERLVDLLPGDLAHCFYAESGSVAVEVALKMARQYWINRGNRGRRRFLSFRHGYHGDTFGAMSVCDPVEGMHTLFAGSLDRQLNVDLPVDDREYERFRTGIDAHGDELAAVIVEPIAQCAGGMKFHDGDVLRRIVDTARSRELLVIFDEIATGFGRTGTLFAAEQAGVTPDIVCLSKALTGGTVPLAVTVAQSHVYEAFLSDDFEHALMHGPTFCGNALACAAANASLDLFATEPRLEQVAAIETRLRDGLTFCRDKPGVADVRVKGAIGVVELAGNVDVDGLRQAFLERDVWIRPFGNVVYLMPAFTITNDELDILIRAVIEVVGARGQAN